MFWNPETANREQELAGRIVASQNNVFVTAGGDI